MKNDLYLHEEFILLALKDEAGTVATSESIEYPLAACLISELILQKRTELDKTKKKPRVIFVNEKSLHDPILDEALEKIKDSKKPKKLDEWVEILANMKKLKHRTAIQLCKRGILHADEDKVLLIFNRKIYPELDPAPERRLVERLREAIFTDTEDINPRDAVLIALAQQTHLLGRKFDKKELQAREGRIKEISEGSLTAGAAKEAQEAMNTVLFVAVIMPIIFD
jgi:hypothetical protein